MIKRLPAKLGVLALRVTGHVAREDLDKCYDLLNESFANRPRTDLYIEVAGLTGFDTEALSADAKRAWSLLGKRDRFGRIAIVSDERWIRWASRVESALLPGVAYRTYTMAEREQALDWVQGRSELPYGHAVKLIETNRADTIGIEIDGRLSAEEIGEVARKVNARRRERPLKAILVRYRALRELDPAMVADAEYLRMKLGLLRELDRYAVVGGPDWLVAWIRLMQPLLRMELRHFAENDEDAAWDWIGAAPVSNQSVAA